MTCWHCDGTDSCECMFCGIRIGVSVLAGPCKSCEGVRNNAELMKKLERYNIDPRDRRHWRRVSNPRDQAPSHLVFDPVFPGEEKRKGAA